LNYEKEAKSMRLDPIDSQIIIMLQNDGRRSFSEIAEAVGRTEVTIRRRVKKLIDEGYIKRFTVVLDPLKVGRKIRAVIRVKTAMKEAAVISKKLREFHEVNEAYFLDGACGLMIMVTVDDLTELKTFLETRLGRIPGVADAETCIVLEEIKSAF
jgi:Lrp/AsnC family transcriptional regulator for asnA, asnC and gidA